MGGDTWATAPLIALAVVTGFVVLAIVIQVLPTVRKATRVGRLIPKGKRAAAAVAEARAAVDGHWPNRVPDGAPPEIRALYRPGPEARRLPLETWEQQVELVGSIRHVTRPGNGAYGAALDIDGSVLVFAPNHDGGYSLKVSAPDGSIAAIIDEPAGLMLGGSIDHGRVAWWHAEPARNRAEIRLWDPVDGTSTLDSIEYTLDRLVTKPSGWVVLAGDAVAATLCAAGPGQVVVARQGEPLVHIGETRFKTVTRDLVAEREGRSQVAVSLFGAETDHSDQLTLLDLSTSPPTRTPVRRGLMPGAATAAGEPVGQWRALHMVELPGGVAAQLPDGMLLMADPRSDGEFVVMGQGFRNEGAPSISQTAVLHLPTGAFGVVDEASWALSDMRGGFVLWTDFQSMAPLRAATSVARLRRPPA